VRPGLTAWQRRGRRDCRGRGAGGRGTGGRELYGVVPAASASGRRVGMFTTAIVFGSESELWRGGRGYRRCHQSAVSVALSVTNTTNGTSRIEPTAAMGREEKEALVSRLLLDHGPNDDQCRLTSQGKQKALAPGWAGWTELEANTSDSSGPAYGRPMARTSPVPRVRAEPRCCPAVNRVLASTPRSHRGSDAPGSRRRPE